MRISARQSKTIHACKALSRKRSQLLSLAFYKPHLLVDFSSREVGVSLLKPAANQRISRLLRLIDQAVQNLQLVFSRSMGCLKSPAMAFHSWIHDQPNPKGCDPPKGPKRLELKKAPPFEPQQGQHGEHLQDNQGLGGQAHHRFLLRLAIRHWLNAPKEQLG